MHPLQLPIPSQEWQFRVRFTEVNSLSLAAVWTVDSYNFTRSALDRLSSSGSSFSSSGYSVGGLAVPIRVAVDGGGNVWSTNAAAAAVSKLTSAGVSASGVAGFIGAGINQGVGIAIDSTGSAWIANSSDSVTKLSNSGMILSGPPDLRGRHRQSAGDRNRRSRKRLDRRPFVAHRAFEHR